MVEYSQRCCRRQQNRGRDVGQPRMRGCCSDVVVVCLDSVVWAGVDGNMRMD